MACKTLLRGLESGDIKVVARDLPSRRRWPRKSSPRGPTPSSTMRRSKSAARNAVSQRRWLDPETAADMGKLDPAAIAAVRAQAWPEVAHADELHDAHARLGVDHRAGRRERRLDPRTSMS